MKTTKMSNLAILYGPKNSHKLITERYSIGKTHYQNNIISAPAIINKFSDSDTKPRGTLLSPPTQAHFNSHSIDLSL